MKNGFESAKDDFDDLVSKWDDALQKGIFKDTPSIPSTAQHTSQDSFFGLKQMNPTDSINSSDADYWRAISSVADGGVDVHRLDEAATELDGPNPVRKGTEGPDSDLTDKAVGSTFNEEDIKKLEDMKVRLHDLKGKVAEMGDNKYEDQIKSLIEKIEQLSNKMGRVKD